MTEPNILRSEDPFLWPFWEAAGRHELAVQKCRQCAGHQFYPRPFCLACGADAPEWVVVGGAGRVHSVTTVRIPITAGLTPPYQVAVVELAEGPRILAGIAGDDCAIGDPVRVEWRAREGAPPFPEFRKVPS